MEGVLNKAEQSERLSEEIKTLIKSHKGNSDIQKQIKNKIDELEIEVKELNLTDPETLEKLLKYIKSLK